MLTALVAFTVCAPVQEPDFFEWGSRKVQSKLLFDGKTLEGWKGYKQPKPPGSWKVENGELVVRPGSGGGGDISTAKEYGDFELSLEWNASKNGNSGVIYRSGDEYEASWQTGPEYQILDDFRGGPGKADLHSSGALYDLYVPSKFVTRPPGEWNSTRIVCKGSHIEHWLNGVKIVDVQVGSPDWNARIEKSKFKAFPLFAKKPKGYILLQDHGAEIRFRNIKIKEG